MRGKPRIRLNNLKTSLRFPCLGLNPIRDSINPIQMVALRHLNAIYLIQLAMLLRQHVKCPIRLDELILTCIKPLKTASLLW